MKRVAEIMHIAEQDRESFVKGLLSPDQETQRIQWLCGVRKQQYFAMNELIFMTFEYCGENFKEDMDRMAAYLDKKGYLIKKRRKDVPSEERATTSWWAPVKRLGSFLETKPFFDDDADGGIENNYMAMLDGSMSAYSKNNISFDEEDWTESISI